MNSEFGRFVLVFLFTWAMLMTGLVLVLWATRPTAQPPVIITQAQPQDEMGCSLFLILLLVALIALLVFMVLSNL